MVEKIGTALTSGGLHNRSFYRVAGLPFSVTLPQGWDAEELLPSFRPFRCGAVPEVVFSLSASGQSLPCEADGAQLLEESTTDMGHVRLLRLNEGAGGYVGREDGLYGSREDGDVNKSGCDGYRIEIDNGSQESRPVHHDGGLADFGSGLAHRDSGQEGDRRRPVHHDGGLADFGSGLAHRDSGQEGDRRRPVHVMCTDSSLRRAVASLRSDDPAMGPVLSSMACILFAQAVLRRDGATIHASCVSMEGRTFLFLGKSGTGKSTHARKWLETFPGCSLLNDDNPVLRIVDGMVTAYGTPWSGKTPCYKDESHPVAGIIRLQQAAANRFSPLEGPEAFAAMLPSCSVIRSDAALQEALYLTLIRVSELVPVACLECRPEREAALVCREGISALKTGRNALTPVDRDTQKKKRNSLPAGSGVCVGENSNKLEICAT